MSDRFALVGPGQLGRLFGGGLLALGHPVEPILRATSAEARQETLRRADRALIAVGEDDSSAALDELPEKLRHGKTWLLENELLPDAWETKLTNPTVLVVWCEKKAGKSVQVVLPTRVAGPDRLLAVRALESVDVPAIAIDDEMLVPALVDKNLYILVSNLAGMLAFGDRSGTVGELLTHHRALVLSVADEILRVETARARLAIAPAAAMDRLWEAFATDPHHAAKGRTAPARLRRLARHAERLGVPIPLLGAAATSSR